jgi:AP-4 complex subunit mu-1
MYVHNEPIAVESRGAGAGGVMASKKTISSSAVQRPISLGTSGGAKKNEIYVDILERLTVLFNSNGYILNSTIDGCIQMKSYLSGNPGLRFALNEDLVVGKENASGYGGVVLDDCNFHECVNLDDFESGRTLALIPPDGEFVVMNYRITSEFRAPFRIFPVLEETSQYKVELVLKIRSDFPEKNHGTNVVIKFPVPKTATSVVPEVGVDASSSALAAGGPSAAARGVSSAVAHGGAGAGAGTGQSAEYDSKERQVVWVIKKFGGGTEQTLRTRITLGSPAGSSLRKELGPISMSFEIPMYNVSALQVSAGGGKGGQDDDAPLPWHHSPTSPRDLGLHLTLASPRSPLTHTAPRAGQVPQDCRDAQELQAVQVGPLRDHLE